MLIVIEEDCAVNPLVLPLASPAVVSPPVLKDNVSSSPASASP